MMLFNPKLTAALVDNIETDKNRILRKRLDNSSTNSKDFNCVPTPRDKLGVAVERKTM